VFNAENGRAALDVLSEHPDVQLIMMDTMMPEMDGLEATRKIRQNPIYHDLPIVSLTAKAMKGDREKCLEAGASDYITKPVDEETLLATIYGWLMVESDARAN
jgi:CheY-like chemotaxis protein